MKKVTILVIGLILLTGLVWLSGTGIEEVDDSNNTVGDNITQEEAERIYKPISSLLAGLATAFPYALVVAAFIGALKFLVDS